MAISSLLSAIYPIQSRIEPFEDYPSTQTSDRSQKAARVKVEWRILYSCPNSLLMAQAYILKLKIDENVFQILCP